MGVVSSFMRLLTLSIIARWIMASELADRVLALSGDESAVELIR